MDDRGMKFLIYSLRGYFKNNSESFVWIKITYIHSPTYCWSIYKNTDLIFKTISVSEYFDSV